MSSPDNNSPSANGPTGPTLTKEQVVYNLERFIKELGAATDKRIESLTYKDTFQVKKKDGSTRTLKYMPATVKEWQLLHDMSDDMMAESQNWIDKIKATKKEELQGVSAAAKKALTAKAVAILAKSAEVFFGLKEEEFYDLDYRQMVEIIAACRVRTDHGDPNP